ncbi:MAG TPA: sulfatase, partial [Acidobacteriota bacterium]|nr:sulfatase [Acidobacteriota bacterium]
MRILYIDIDSLRPDHLGCYGYHRVTSPHIDRIAAEGLRFENFYATDTPCLPSRTALFSGRFGINTGVVNHGGTRADIRPEGPGRGFQSRTTLDALPEQLRGAGLRTASISPFPHRHSAYQIWEGFHETIDTGGDGNERAHVVYPEVAAWLERNATRENWFLHVNLWDPHTPYDVPLEYGEPFRDAPPPAWLTQEIIDRQRRSYGPHDAVTPHGHTVKNDWPRGTKTIRNVADWKQWIDGYDTGIHYADHHVGKIIADLKRLRLYDDTVIIISSDHGENQGELEIYGDHQTADQHTNRVPLIIRWPGVTDGRAAQTESAFLYNIDLSATLVEMAGGKKPAAWDATSFAPLLREKGTGHPYLVLSHGAWSCQRSVRWDRYLLIRTYHTGAKNFPSLMLFDLAADPHETNNLAAKRPDLVGAGLRMMDDWVGRQLARNGTSDPLFD